MLSYFQSDLFLTQIPQCQPFVAAEIAGHEGARTIFKNAVEYVQSVVEKHKSLVLPPPFSQVPSFVARIQRTV